MDTLGVLYLRKGLADRAVSLLEEAHAGLPEMAEVSSTWPSPTATQAARTTRARCSRLCRGATRRTRRSRRALRRCSIRSRRPHLRLLALGLLALGGLTGCERAVPPAEISTRLASWDGPTWS